MNGPSAYECCLCLGLYNFNTADTQAVTLQCGHSFCRGCLGQVLPKRCPTCRVSFSGNTAAMAPNYSLRDAMVEGLPAMDPLVDALRRLGVDNAESMVLPPDTLVLGEVMSRAGASGPVHRGMLNGAQASQANFDDNIQKEGGTHALLVLLHPKYCHCSTSCRPKTV